MGKGNRKQLQCVYHAWTYGLDGRLRRAPEMEGVQWFEPSNVSLPPLRVEEWPPLVFVNLSASGPSFRETVPEIPEEVRRAGFLIETMRLVERRDYEVEANWKIYIDNYLITDYRSSRRENRLPNAGGELRCDSGAFRGLPLEPFDPESRRCSRAKEIGVDFDPAAVLVEASRDDIVGPERSGRFLDSLPVELEADGLLPGDDGRPAGLGDGFSHGGRDIGRDDLELGLAAQVAKGYDGESGHLFWSLNPKRYPRPPQVSDHGERGREKQKAEHHRAARHIILHPRS